jgi:hypothetical protein
MGPVSDQERGLRPAQERALGQLRAELSRVVRYDDESIVAERWVRQRYDSGRYPSYAPARAAAVRTAWHEAGHAVAALTVGATFTSASIHSARRSGASAASSAASASDRPGRATEGRVRGVTGAADLGFVIDAAGQIAERLMDWTLLDRDDALRAWLPTWTSDGGDARRFRRGAAPRFGANEVAAWRFSEGLLTPHRLRIRQVARALLVHPRHLPYAVVAALADDA